ncbi:glycosyltransferase family 2 protein [Paenibacillus agricola]|uniref:Glycosyltransferase family 2 protein n=1 Tax=Paenibacillus agricola TaxID=2716264 RepID=A0ABX0J3G2_9BACL|nr:glycosyltransferase family 2 protein [Paenibacillus agricola]NHN30198.1 glycosyltransferase family 2 protein [Paenibacillus agricola]
MAGNEDGNKYQNETTNEDPVEKELTVMKHRNPLITVVIPTYNRAKYIRRGIESVLRQTCKRWKMLIVDDGSKDGTKKVISRYLSDPRIRYVRLKKNRGVCFTLNHALKLVDTKYFSQLDADDWYEPNTLETCLKKMKRSSRRVAVVYGHERVWKAKRGGKIKYLETKKKRSIRGKYDFIKFHPMIYPRFYRTKALRAVGGWSRKVPQRGRFAEDRQILLKLAGRYKFKATHKSLYNRLNHSNNISRSKNRHKYANVTRYLYNRALKRWGNVYKAKFVWVNGRLKVGKLIKRKR